ncbi:hypothetical protein DESPIGER_1480 [Desulfovibrio piger]|uniref:Uncharacterized protein n=1 Tax=Desulfovibrio piger TaxID=901 RepID=A0A1K1LF44_9BACT|nr:hypothetical protein DESPIGER_1480 [Desulfovibrio piger]
MGLLHPDPASHGRTIRPKLHMLFLSNTRASFTKNAENR